MPWTRSSPSSFWGTQAWTVGDSKAPNTDSTTSRAPMIPRAWPRGRVRAASSTASPAQASRVTMILRRSPRSARIPPKGDRTIVGTMATDRKVAKRTAEPVTSRMYMDRANFKV